MKKKERMDTKANFNRFNLFFEGGSHEEIY